MTGGGRKPAFVYKSHMCVAVLLINLWFTAESISNIFIGAGDVFETKSVVRVLTFNM